MVHDMAAYEHTHTHTERVYGHGLGHGHGLLACRSLHIDRLGIMEIM